MKGRYPVLLAVLALIYGLACSFSASLGSDPATPTAAPVEPTATRPQSVFINAVSAPVATPEVNDPPPAAPPPAPQMIYAAPGGYYPPAQSYYAQPYYCAPNYNWAYSYVVQMGDTLSNIASRAGTTWQAVAQANCIPNPNQIYVGQTLRLPCAISHLPYYPPPPHYPSYPQQPYYPPPQQHYPQPPHYPPGHGGHGYSQPTPQPQPTYAPPMPTPIPPIVMGSALSISPYSAINNNTIILPPDQLVTITWNGTFPTATDHVEFDLIPPGGGAGQAMGIVSNPGSGASIQWNSVNGLQGTLQAVAYFQGGYAPQYSDSYYIIDGSP